MFIDSNLNVSSNQLDFLLIQAIQTILFLYNLHFLSQLLLSDVPRRFGFQCYIQSRIPLSFSQVLRYFQEKYMYWSQKFLCPFFSFNQFLARICIFSWRWKDDPSSEKDLIFHQHSYLFRSKYLRRSFCNSKVLHSHSPLLFEFI